MVVFNDPHFSARPPASRKSNYLQCIYRKALEIVEYANEINADVLACTGDWFISKKPESTPYWMISGMHEIFAKFKGIFISTIGNHDCEASLATFSHSPLYVLLNLLKAQYNTDSGIVYNVDGVEIAVVNYDKGSSVAGIKSVAGDFGTNTNMRIMLVHGPIMHPSFSGQYPPQFVEKAVQASELVGMADYIFYGDIHDYHGIYTLNAFGSNGIDEGNWPFKTTFCNLGSIARNTAKELNRYRPVLAAEFYSGTGDIAEIELENVEPAEEVFRVEELRYDKMLDEEIEGFVSSLDTESLAFTVLTPDVLRNRIKGAAELNALEQEIGLAAIDQVDK